MINALNFDVACIKTLSAVEANPNRSNQHELNGVAQLRRILGSEKSSFEGKFSIRGRNIEVPATVTWYDARENHPSRTEYRLYFQTNEVMEVALEGDTLVMGYDPHGQFWLELVN